MQDWKESATCNHLSTYPSVATLILTPGGKTVRRAVKQANKVDPVVNT